MPKDPRTFADIIGLIIDIINPLLVLVAGLALLAFLKGLAVFIFKAGDEASHKDGRDLMIWGLIGLFVMVSVIGILRFAYKDFGFGSTGRAFGVPTLKTQPIEF